MPPAVHDRTNGAYIDERDQRAESDEQHRAE
jgi:hypothetical protein